MSILKPTGPAPHCLAPNATGAEVEKHCRLSTHLNNQSSSPYTLHHTHTISWSLLFLQWIFLWANFFICSKTPKSSGYHSMRFDEYTPNYKNAENDDMPQKVTSCSLPINPCLHPTPGNYCSDFYHLRLSFICSRPFYKQKPTGGIIFCLVAFTPHHAFDIHPWCCTNQWSLPFKKKFTFIIYLASLHHAGTFCVAPELSRSAACGISVPWPGLKLRSPVLQGRSLTTGPRGRSL